MGPADLGCPGLSPVRAEGGGRIPRPPPAQPQRPVGHRRAAAVAPLRGRADRGPARPRRLPRPRRAPPRPPRLRLGRTAPALGFRRQHLGRGWRPAGARCLPPSAMSSAGAADALPAG